MSNYRTAGIEVSKNIAREVKVRSALTKAGKPLSLSKLNALTNVEVPMLRRILDTMCLEGNAVSYVTMGKKLKTTMYLAVPVTCDRVIGHARSCLRCSQILNTCEGVEP